MPDMTTREAAAYLAEHGYTVGRRWHGGRGPISARTLRKWCEVGRFQGAVKVGEGNRAVWKIPQGDLEKLLNQKDNLALTTTPDTTPDGSGVRKSDAPFEASPSLVPGTGDDPVTSCFSDTRELAD